MDSSTDVLARPSPRRASAEEVWELVALYRDHYLDHNIRHFYEACNETHGWEVARFFKQFFSFFTSVIQPTQEKDSSSQKQKERVARLEFLTTKNNKIPLLSRRSTGVMSSVGALGRRGSR